VTAKPNAVQNNTSSFGTASSNTVAAKKEINPDIPIGTTYELSQGEYECGDDFPAGRYKIEWLSGNQFGGYINTIKGCKQIGDQLSVNTDYPCFFEFENGDQFEVSLINIRLTKIPSVKNEYFKENDGSYVFGDGYYQGEVDIPSGKYNVTAINGNQFGIYVTVNGDMKSLDQGETYNNLTIKDAATIEVSLGQARFTPKG
jgi:hypothetical protein